MVSELINWVRSEWKYLGSSEMFVSTHTWTDGRQRVHVQWRRNKDGSGWFVTVKGPETDERLNEELVPMLEALHLADSYMGEGGGSFGEIDPSRFEEA